MKFWVIAFSVVLLAMIGLAGLWLLDLAEAVTPPLDNGFWTMGVTRTFHVGLWMAIGSFTAIILLMVLLLWPTTR